MALGPSFLVDVPFSFPPHADRPTAFCSTGSPRPSPGAPLSADTVFRENRPVVPTLPVVLFRQAFLLLFRLSFAESLAPRRNRRMS